MKATISLEYIGERQDAQLAMGCKILDEAMPGVSGLVVGNSRPRKPWVAEITGRDSRFCYARNFLSANWQRRRANGPHSRGVELWFVLESGRIYEVKEPVSWCKSERYFCTVEQDGSIRRLADKEVEEWLSAISG